VKIVPQDARHVHMKEESLPSQATLKATQLTQSTTFVTSIALLVGTTTTILRLAPNVHNTALLATTKTTRLLFSRLYQATPLINLMVYAMLPVVQINITNHEMVAI